MKTQRQWLLVLVCVLGLGFLGFLALAGSAAPDRDEDQVLQGSFVATIHQNPPRKLKALFTFTRDGGLVEENFTPSLTSPFGPVAIAHGAWARTGDHQFALTYLFLGQTPGDKDSSYVRGKVLAQITLKEGGKAYSGIAQITSFDPLGNVIGRSSETVEATRIGTRPNDD